MLHFFAFQSILCYNLIEDFSQKGRGSMVTIPLKVSEELAKQLIPLQDHLPEIVKLGLRHWRKARQAPLTPRQQAETLWAETGLVIPLNPAVAQHYPRPGKRQPPVQAGGIPASQIIIEQRGAL
jgi:hypothetical protein